MQPLETAARILLLREPADGPADPPGALRALEHLGEHAEVQVVEDPQAVVERAARREVELVVVEARWSPELARAVEALRVAGPPVVVLTPEHDKETAVAAFRAGAADCVSTGAGFPALLAPVVLEQLRQWRAHCQRETLEKRVGDLTLYNEYILHNMNSALLVVDPEGAVTTANRVAERILDEPAEALRGRSVWDWFPGPAEPLWLHRALREGARLRGVEARLVRRDGAVVPIGVSVGPLLDRDGCQLGAVAIFQDLTEVNALRRQLLQKEKLASIGQLAAGVAHEINNPMGFIDANLMQMGEYLVDLRRLWDEIRAMRNAVRAGDWASAASAGAGLDALAGELDAEFLLADLSKAVVESREGSARIRRIVQDLRVFSRQDPPERVPADLNQCLDSTANIAWSMMKNVVVLTKDYAELPPLPCDAQQLKQVFLNLLVNAYQAILERVGPAGGEEGEIRLETEHRDGRIRVRVVDNGVGIDPAHLERIFDPFFTTKEVGVGTGLGLSTSFNIVRAHGGRIRVESEPGRGARFELEFPLAAEEPGAAPESR